MDPPPTQPSSAGSATAPSSSPSSTTPSVDPSLVITHAILPIGAKVFVDKDGEKRQAEILARQPKRSGMLTFYVHYVEFNKRLDEWVPESRIDLNMAVLWPKQGKKAIGSHGSPAASGPQKKTNSRHNNNNNNETIDLDDAVNALNGNPAGGVPYDRGQEIEKLRTSGSMTQNALEVSRVKNISRIIMGEHEVEPWYFSPYPVELTEVDIIYICEFTLSYFASRKQFERFRSKTMLRHPPGNEIYRDERVSFFEIDGRKQRTWCRNLCLLSKLFLDHKTLYYDVDPFLFYCMTRRDDMGHHLVGYFSKEKESAEGYNVACILTLPQYQRHGYGRILIDFSYALSKRESKFGSPEKPLSDLGLLSYRAYWADTVIELLVENSKAGKTETTIEDIASITAMTTTDILHTLGALNMLKYYKGQHIICLTDALVDKYEREKAKKRHRIDSSLLKWKPPVFSASQLRFGW
ncbi:uncharacterized protein SAPINGB_P005289 [Magnusiomyces paraingens]|uniref:Histone acetyltransferase ESA1 n=1 Tax=Magnusiomyces paraingens TaxID=2606893 RepID=A0A5E8C0A5_9ASCO|nr:uncharacterized protein SAPINGB_P005289 [Saprochaete ingens]VVT56802.1 unnamed protein product [Saprochaete ingens]